MDMVLDMNFHAYYRISNIFSMLTKYQAYNFPVIHLSSFPSYHEVLEV